MNKNWMKDISPQELAALLAMCPVALYAMRVDGEDLIPVWVSPQVKSILGYDKDEYLGKSDWWSSHLHPDDRDAALARMRGALSTGHLTQEYRFRARDGGYLWINDELKVSRNSSGAPIKALGAWTDITQRSRVEQEARLLLAAITPMAEAPDLMSASKVTLNKVCQITGWAYGEAWVPQRDGTALELGATSSVSSDVLREFRERSLSFMFAPGEGIPGRVWSTSQPEWWPDVSKLSRQLYPRVDLAAEAGLKAAFAVAIPADDGPLAVLAFYMFEERAEDRRWIEIVSAVAQQLGVVLQKRDAEQALYDTENQLRAIVDNSPNAIYLKDPTGRYLFTNKQFEKWYGRESENHIGKTVYEVFPRNLAEIYDAYDRKVIDTREVVDSETQVPIRDGTLQTVISTKFPVFDNDGRVVAIGGINVDMTQNRILRARAVDAYCRLVDSIEATSSAFSIFDREDKLYLCNSAYREMFPELSDIILPGTSFEELVRAAVKKGLILNAIGREEEWIANRLLNHRSAEKESEQQLNDGRWLLVSERRTDDGSTITVRTDISSLKRKERLLEESKDFVNTILSQAPDAIIAADEEGKILTFNSAAQKIFGYEESEVIGSNVSILMPEPHRSKHDTYLSDYLRTGIRKTLGNGPRAVTAVRKNGTTFKMEFACDETANDGKRIYVGAGHDVTEREIIQKQLVHSEKLAMIGRMSAGMAHEMKQPLNVIRMAAERSEIEIEEGEYDLEQQKRQLEVIQDHADRMADIIDHMNAFSRKDLARSELFNPIESVRKAIGLVEEAMRLADIGVSADLDERCRPIYGYPLRLEQVIVNLLTNAKDAILGQAVAETDMVPGYRGSISVDLVDDVGLERVRISVADTGGGIPEQMMETIFEPFFTTKKVGEGTGLGLWLTHNIITEMGGRIEVTNRAEGARFQISVPVDRRGTIRGDAKT